MTVSRAHDGRGASPRTARAINDRLALRLLRREGPLTAGQLKELIGMSRPSVADLVERLQRSGLIEVVGEAGESNRGPNARVYGIVAGRAHVAGLDVRLESVGVEIADLLGRTVARALLPVAPGADPARTVEDAIGLLRRAARRAGVTALHTVAFGAPGMIDPVTGRIDASTALPAWHGDLADEVRKRFGVPVLLENEVNLAAIAEQRARSKDGDETFVLLWIGGGVGAAVVLDGRLRRGVSGGAGEVGFLPIGPGGALPSATDCEDGYHGLVGSRAVCALGRAHGLRPAGGRAADPAEGPAAGSAGGSAQGSAGGPVAGASAGAAAGSAARGDGDGDGHGQDGDAAAAFVRAALAAGPAGEGFLEELAGRIALGASAVCAVLDPGRVVLAGEVGQAGGAALAGRVAARLARLSPLRTLVEATAVADAPILRGAVATATDAAQDALFSPRA